MQHGSPHDPRQRLNDHHGDDLLAVARVFGGHPDAVAARAEGVDDGGVDLTVETPRGSFPARVDFAEAGAGEAPAGPRLSFRDLARRARAALAGEGGSPASS